MKSYITKNPPIYNDIYKLNFSKFFINRRKIKLTQLLREELKISLSTLTKKDRNVLRFRFGLTNGKPKTLEEVAQQYGTTPKKIRQIEAKALRRLRYPPRT